MNKKLRVLTPKQLDKVVGGTVKWFPDDPPPPPPSK